MERGGIKSNNCSRWERDNRRRLAGRLLDFYEHEPKCGRCKLCVRDKSAWRRRKHLKLLHINTRRENIWRKMFTSGRRRQIKKKTWGWAITALDMQPLVITGATWSGCLEESVQHSRATCALCSALPHSGATFCFCTASALKFHCSPPRDSVCIV